MRYVPLYDSVVRKPRDRSRTLSMARSTKRKKRVQRKWWKRGGKHGDLPFDFDDAESVKLVHVHLDGVHSAEIL